MAIANKQKFFGSIEFKIENGNVSVIKKVETKLKPSRLNKI